jgi:hypothetical protein
MGEANSGDLSDHPFPSLWDDETRSYRFPDQQEQRNMFLKLLETYTNLSAVSDILPWCVLEFEDELPCYEDGIFLVAGLVAVYILEGEGDPLGTISMGWQGEGDPSIDPEHMNLELQPYHVPSFETFNTCVGIADAATGLYLPRDLLVAGHIFKHEWRPFWKSFWGDSTERFCNASRFRWEEKSRGPGPACADCR